MMVQPSPSVARWCSSISLGMLVSVLVRVHTGFHGAGIESLLSLAAAGCILFVLAGGTPHTSTRWRWAMWLLPMLVFAIGSLLVGLSVALHSTIGTTAAAPMLGSLCLFLCTLPAVRIACTAQRAGRGRFRPLLFLIGLFAAHTHTDVFTASIVAVALLTFCDTVPHPERGWTPNRPEFNGHDILITALAGLWISSGWAHLRTPFDPTSFGALAVLAGATFVHVAPRIARATPMFGLAVISGAIWAAVVHMDRIAPRVASWGLNGYGPDIDPTLWLSLPLFILGVCLGSFVRCSTINRWPWLALAAGLWSGPYVITGSTMLWCSVGIAGLSGLIAKRSLEQFAAGAVVVSLVVLEGTVATPDFPATKMGVWNHSHSARSLAKWTNSPDKLARGVAALSPAGSLITWTDGEPSPHLATTLDGLTRSNRGNLAKAEEFAGHLAALLPDNPEGVLILGDDLGNGLRGLAAHPVRVAQLSAPFPISTRFLAQADEVRQKLWVSPSNPLFAEHPSALLHRVPPVGAIVEISHRPWADGASMRWDRKHLQSIRSRLTDDGLYILCVHLRFWPPNSVSAIGQALDQTFENVQVWAAPEGPDSMLFVASDSAISFENIATRYGDGRIGLESLGFTSAETLAGSALLGTDGVRGWASTADRLPPGDRLNPSVFSKPYLHAGPIAKWMSEFQDPWTDPVPDAVNDVRDARRLLLDLYQQATEGRLESAFLSARKLASGHGEVGREAIAQLIEPHVSDARKAIAKARPEGPTSKYWDDALRFATTAKMLAPNQAQPHTLLGELALARGKTEQATTHFVKALELESSHVPALDGIAQVARLENDKTKAQQALRDATRYAPRDWRAWHNLAVFQLESGNTAQAMENIDTAVGLSPDSEVAPLLVLTKVLLERGEAGAALLRAEQCTQIAPKNGLSWYLRGRAHYDLNRFTEAEKDFRKAVLTDSSLIEARGGVGLVRAILGDPEAAIIAFKEVLKLDPNNGAARENLRRLQVLVPDPGQP